MSFLASLLLLAGLANSASLNFNPWNNPTLCENVVVQIACDPTEIGKYEPSQYAIGFIDGARRLCIKSHGDEAYIRTDKSFLGDCYDVGSGVHETDYHVCSTLL
ncbi:hypothetical protein Ptr902_11872 [Pyrenophora tritici-repentis]|uniref:Uncharacterized protein n=1 Tax=Pyrenophora tritici-repentis TaxID=45151 RepID=A0A5M9LG98_9PLEO|nr:hypothetical protein PtrV1_04775 [Pyrenophora tritici-repentis]KAF7452474.1 hypothetical protein A1F99_042520 [Pyrenophora tritici-repentis]KAF7574403.1 hypothetical protein PtrM4_060260 [Pyrenophora tritici-repentis]KAI0587749.1 hypothetical protein Alg215_01331 [Pyrenophora tritici-repentis]KAI0589159.1 hypothetical protein Alg130_03051 [Pyrenophora tritici-repentis]